MKKMIFSLTFGFLLLLSLTVQAKTEERIDKQFDFTKLKTIAIDLDINAQIYNGIREYEITDVFYETLKSELHDKTSKTKYCFVPYPLLFNEFMKENNLENTVIEELPADKQAEINKKYIEYARSKTDALIRGTVWIYDLGTSYHEGYYYTLPSQVYSTVTTNIGVNATIRTDGQTLHYKQGGNYPTAYCLVRWDVIDAKTNQPIWSRIDDRARVNMDVLQNTKPKDLLRRVVKSMSSDLLKRMKISN